MPPYDPRAFMKLMFYSIGFLLICTYLFANENSDLSGTTYPTENVKVLLVMEEHPNALLVTINLYSVLCVNATLSLS